MLYFWSLAVLAVGLILLVLLLVKAYRVVRRFQGVQRRVAHDLADRGGMVKARIAGLQVAFAERRRS